MLKLCQNSHSSKCIHNMEGSGGGYVLRFIFLFIQVSLLDGVDCAQELQ